MKNALTNLLQNVGLAWWVEVTTEEPRCTYYFGPFLTADEAEKFHPGYLQDLRQENARGIKSKVKRCKPQELTIAEDIEIRNPQGIKVYSN